MVLGKEHAEKLVKFSSKINFGSPFAIRWRVSTANDRLMKILILLSLLSFVACSQKEQVVSQTLDEPLGFTLDSLKQERCVGENCATLRLVWPVANGKNAEKINQAIAEEVNKSLLLGDELIMTRDSLISSFFGMFEEQKRDFPDSPGGYELELDGSVSYQSDSTVSLEFGWFSFLGGAHPNHGVNFFNLDAGTGDYLSLDRLVRDEGQLKTLAEEKFREFHEVAEGVSLADDGRFFLPETGFFLANAMGFKEDKFWIVYVPYEIGPYAMGYTELEFTREELGDLVRW